MERAAGSFRRPSQATLGLMATPGLVLIAWAVRSFLVGGLGRAVPYLTFFPAVMICTLLGGWKAGFLGTLLSTLMALFFIQEGRVSILEGLAMAIFAVSALGLVLLLDSRRRALAELKRSEARSKIMLSAIQDGFALFEILTDTAGNPVDYRILEANATYAAMLGMTKEQVDGRTIRELLPHFEQRWIEPYGRVGLRGESLEVEHFSQLLQRWVHIHAYSPAPGLVGVVVVDIHQGKAADERRFRALFEHAPLGIAIHDLEGHFREANPAFLRMTGYALEELVGMHFRHLNTPEEVEDNLSRREAMLKGEAETVQKELWFVRKDGTRIQVGLTVCPVHDPEGRVLFTFALAEDIGARKEAETALQRVLREKEIILATADVGICIVVGRRQKWLNRWMEVHFQYSLEEMEEQSPRLFYPSEEDFETHALEAEAALARDGAFESVRELVRKDGQTLWIHALGRAIQPADPDQGVLWILTDVTQGQRQERLNLAMEAEAAKGKMAAYIAHEINGPLAGIRNAFLLVEAAVPEGHPDRSFAVLVKQEIDRVSRIVQLLYELHKPLEPGPVEVEVQAVLKDICWLLGSKARTSQVELRLEPGGPGPALRLHANPLRQVLYNLLQNAIEASPAGGLVICAARRQGNTLELRVTDQGPGIAPDLAERIWEPGFTTKHGLTMGGMGLGLATCRRLLECMAGSVNYHNEPQGGCTFEVRLPLAQELPHEP